MQPYVGLIIACIASLVIGSTPRAQTAREGKIKDYEKRLREHRVDAAQAYVNIGWWARKVGMVPQATTMFLRAAEAGNHEHLMADRLVGTMRSLGDAFWRTKRKKIPRALLADYELRVADADRRTRRSHGQLAQLALGIDRGAEAREHCLQAMRLGAQIVVDAKGKAKLDGLVLPAALASWLEEQTVVTAQGTHVFEPAAAAGGPRLEKLHEHRTERVVVRTDTTLALAQELCGLATALLPHLEDRLDGAPTRPLVLLVFGKRADYDAYLRSLGINSAGSGLAEYGSFQTIVCAEGMEPDAIHALVLHELSHLFFFGVAPAAMPDWYAEGFAESFGGQGSFAYDGKTLQVGGLMRRDRIERLRAAPLPLRELLAADAEQLWSTDRDRAGSFYVQCWALQRFLRSEACPWRQRFADWEAECRGAVLGAEAGTRKLGNRQPAQALFDKEFAKDLPQLESAFRAWLEKL